LLQLLSIALVPRANCADYRVSLPNGFELVRSNPYQHNICRDGGIVVVPHDIIKYTIVKDWVLGEAIIPKAEAFPALKSGARKGFFIVDTSSKDVKSGLSEKEFLSQIDILKIKRPLPFVEVAP